MCKCCSQTLSNMFFDVEFTYSMCSSYRVFQEVNLIEANGTKQINFFFRSLYAGDVWLKNDLAKTLADALIQFIRTYLALAKASYDLGVNHFSLIPKIHALHEVQFEMVRQCALGGWVLNPIVETCSVDEDLIGRVANLTRKVSPQLIAKRALARYLVQINFVWAR